MNFRKRKGPPTSVNEEEIRFVCCMCGEEIAWTREPGWLDVPELNAVPYDEIRYGVRGKRKCFTFHGGQCQDDYFKSRKNRHQQLLDDDKK